MPAHEAEVGTRLLARNTHSVALTEQGAEFLRSARRIVAEADWVGRRLNLRTEEGGTFTVVCVSGALYDALPARVRAARLELPNLQFRLVEMTETALAQQVLDGTTNWPAAWCHAMRSGWRWRNSTRWPCERPWRSVIWPVRS